MDLSKALEPFDAGLAEQVEHPSALLLRGKAKPKSIPRPFCRLDGTYPAYVKRNARAGLQVLKPPQKIYKFKGKPLYSGAFAVAKNLASHFSTMSTQCIGRYQEDVEA